MTNSASNSWSGRLQRGGMTIAAGALAIGLAGCEIGPKAASQRGYRGTGMEDIYDRSGLDRKVNLAAAAIPAAPPPAPAPTAGPLPWRNVQVLNDVGPGELTRTMISMSNWVTGGPGNCTYCHNIAALGDDTLPGGRPIYTKLVARRMLQMVRTINGRHQDHVLNTGVTCYTCHLGKPLPNGLWFYTNVNQLERYFLDRDAVRVQSHEIPASNDNRSSVKQAEWTYALMIRIASSLGVSCGHCHNTRAFESWQEAPPQRTQAYAGAQMVRDLNQHYLSPLQSVFPPSRRGPMGDSPKLQCVTCHNGAYKPLFGYPMAKDYPALWGRPDWNGTPFPAIPASEPRGASPAAAASAAAAPHEATTGAMGGKGPTGKGAKGKP